MGNYSWFNSMSDSQATFGPRGLSNHCPVILNTGLHLRRLKKPFQFFNFMLELEGFNDAVSDCWNNNIRGNSFFTFNKKLRRTKRDLVALNSSNGNLSSNVSNLQVQLAFIQLSLHFDPLNSYLLAQETNCSQPLWKALTLEESLLLQKSRAIWLA